MYFGGEYEWLFHYRHKIKSETNGKVTWGEWFSKRTKTFLPSVFIGFQFPKGYNLMFKYYLQDFLNPAFKGKEAGADVDFANLDRTQVYYVSLSYYLNNEKLKKKKVQNDLVAWH
ncbi:MAG: hypothetical protein HC896_09540 [Bacteroidales bacterium]|nr:hypothetical protein [Bacteroidales bacterium]